MVSERIWMRLLPTAAVVIALASARPFAAGWNDGSRLATVESLVDHGTWAIDDSIFVTVPPDAYPYRPDDPFVERGTLDKLRIGEHWYSDKSPLLAVWLALCYQVLQSLTGLTARSNPAAFCYVMTVLSCGLAYVIAVLTCDRMARVIGLCARSRQRLVLALALATLAPVYARSINNHLPFLAAAALIALRLAHVAVSDPAPARWALIGFLASLGYALDLGAGPPLVLALAVLAVYRGQVPALVCFLAAAFPVFAAHHALNYHLGGTFVPANAVPAYVLWPGSPFDDMTGRWHHASAFRFAVYAAELLVGKSGFLLHNLPLLLAFFAAVPLLRRRPRETPELLAVIAACAGMWLVYAISSRNYAGGCCSIRWFLPAIPLGFYVLAVQLREDPRATTDLIVLTLGGMFISASAWAKESWATKMVPGFWYFLAATLLAWAVIAARRARSPAAPPGVPLLSPTA